MESVTFHFSAVILPTRPSTLAVATIKEHSLQLPGVEIVETSARSYDQSDICLLYTSRCV